MALNVETENVTLNFKLKSDDDFECRNWEAMMALNVETENVALNAELKEMVTLNAEIENWWWF